jgi:hypothetical protein
MWSGLLRRGNGAALSLNRLEIAPLYPALGGWQDRGFRDTQNSKLTVAGEVIEPYPDRTS